MGLPAKRLPTFVRRLRKETAIINGALVKFYRKGRKWHWRAVGKVRVEK